MKNISLPILPVLAGADPPESGSPLLWKVLFNTRTFAGSGRRAFQLFINGIDGIQRISVRVDLKKRCQVFYCGQFRECVLQMNFVLAQVGVYNPVDICLLDR